MRIAILADRLELGGVETHIVSQINELLDRGHTILLSAAAAYQDLLQQIRASNSFQYLPLTENYAEDIKRFKPQIIHAHPFTAIIKGHKVAKELRVPFFVTVHGPYDYALDRSPLGVQVSQSLNRIIAVNMAVAAVLCNEAVHPEKVSVIRNGIDLKTYYPLEVDRNLREEYGFTCSWFTFVIISRFSDGKEKPIHQLLKIAPVIAENLSGLNIVLVGDGPWITSLQQTADELQHHLLNIKFAGRQLDVKQFLQMSDLVFACGRAALEAMACQRPVFAINSPGFGSLINAKTHSDYIFKREGFSYPLEDELASKVTAICTDNDSLQEAAIDGYQVVSKFYNLTETTNQLERLYRQYVNE